MKKAVTRLLCTYGTRMLRASFFILCSLFISPIGAQTQSGKASFYSKRATGARTANGERLHHDSLTCAHRNYPFGTLLRVTNVLNGKQVVVRVNDRGPFRKGRIIDLSWGAAKELGMISQGIAPVTVEKINEPNVPFLPDDYDLTKFEFELADIDPTGITPVWQEELNIDHKEVQRSMHHTIRKAAAEKSKDSKGSKDSKDRKK